MQREKKNLKKLIPHVISLSLLFSHAPIPNTHSKALFPGHTLRVLLKVNIVASVGAGVGHNGDNAPCNNSQ